MSVRLESSSTMVRSIRQVGAVVALYVLFSAWAIGAAFAVDCTNPSTNGQACGNPATGTCTAGFCIVTFSDWVRGGNPLLDVRYYISCGGVGPGSRCTTAVGDGTCNSHLACLVVVDDAHNATPDRSDYLTVLFIAVAVGLICAMVLRASAV